MGQGTEQKGGDGVPLATVASRGGGGPGRAGAGGGRAGQGAGRGARAALVGAAARPAAGARAQAPGHGTAVPRAAAAAGAAAAAASAVAPGAAPGALPGALQLPARRRPALPRPAGRPQPTVSTRRPRPGTLRRLASLLFDPLYLDAWIKTRCLSHSATSQGDEKPKLGSCPCHPLPRLDALHPPAPGGPRPTLSPWLGQWPGAWSCPQATWEGLSLQLLKGMGRQTWEVLRGL